MYSVVVWFLSLRLSGLPPHSSCFSPGVFFFGRISAFLTPSCGVPPPLGGALPLFWGPPPGFPPHGGVPGPPAFHRGAPPGPSALGPRDYSQPIVHSPKEGGPALCWDPSSTLRSPRSLFGKQPGICPGWSPRPGVPERKGHNKPVALHDPKGDLSGRQPMTGVRGTLRRTEHRRLQGTIVAKSK